MGKFTTPCVTLMLPCALVGCTTYAPIAADQLKADGKHNYFVLANNYHDTLQKIEAASKLRHTNFPSAIFEMTVQRKGEPNTVVATEQYHFDPNKRIYRLNAKDQTLQLSRIGALVAVNSTTTYDCRWAPYGRGKHYTYTRTCFPRTQYETFYDYQNITDAPVIKVEPAGLHFYGSRPSANDLNDITEKAKAIHLPLYGF
ncbi:MAG: hypothetical protein ACRCV6_09395 [Formosimonas sp.]